MEIFFSLAIGIIAGFSAGKMIGNGGLGLKFNLPIGIISSLLGGLFATYLGVKAGSELIIATCAMSALSVIFTFSIIDLFLEISRKLKRMKDW